MARPIKNNMDYFSHDNKMRNDRKIKALRAKFGLQGYAVFNMFLELLCEAELLVIEWNEMERELISGDFGLPADELDDITNYLVHIELLQRSNGWLYCENLDKRSDNVFDKRTRNLDSLRSENGVNISETHVSDAESTQSKVKHSKVKKSIIKGEGEKNWKNDFDTYIEEMRTARKELFKNTEWLEKQQSFNPGVDIKKSIDKSCVNYWATEAGWKNKKRKQIKTVDWKATFANAISSPQNRVYLPR
jgi:hypothetical protein